MVQVVKTYCSICFDDDAEVPGSPVVAMVGDELGVVDVCEEHSSSLKAMAQVIASHSRALDGPERRGVEQLLSGKKKPSRLTRKDEPRNEVGASDDPEQVGCGICGTQVSGKTQQRKAHAKRVHGVDHNSIEWEGLSFTYPCPYEGCFGGSNSGAGLSRHTYHMHEK